MESYLILFFGTMVLLILLTSPFIFLKLMIRNDRWQVAVSLMCLLFVVWLNMKAMIYWLAYAASKNELSTWRVLFVLGGCFAGYFVNTYAYKYLQKVQKRHWHQKFLKQLSEGDIYQQLRNDNLPKLSKWIEGYWHPDATQKWCRDDFRYEIQMYLYAKGTQKLCPAVILLLDHYGFHVK